MAHCRNCGQNGTGNRSCVLCGCTDFIFHAPVVEPKERVSVLVSAHFTCEAPGLKSEVIRRIMDMERKLK